MKSKKVKENLVLVILNICTIIVILLEEIENTSSCKELF